MQALGKVIAGVAFTLLFPQLSYSAPSGEVFGWQEEGIISPEQASVKIELDSSAEGSSIAAENIVPFDKGDEKWVRFVMKVPKGIIGTVVDVPFERKVLRTEKFKGAIGGSHRQIVKMSVCVGHQLLQEDFSLKAPGKKDFNVTLGRNSLQHLGLVDAGRSNTVKPDCSASAGKPAS